MAILLVPLATAEGTQKNTEESIEPPPAIVFKKPARQPTETRIVIDPRSALPDNQTSQCRYGHRMPTCAAQSCPLTAEFLIKKAIASAISSGRIRRPI